VLADFTHFLTTCSDLFGLVLVFVVAFAAVELVITEVRRALQ
jgi:hypothetical protein